MGDQGVERHTGCHTRHTGAGQREKSRARAESACTACAGSVEAFPRPASGTSGADAIAGFWLVASFRTSLRKTCFEQLDKLGFRHFEPWLAVRKTPREIVRTPLFAGYLFVAFEPGNPAWIDIRYTVGITDILRETGGRPQLMPRGYVEWLIATGDVELDDARDVEIRPGAPVRISAGPMAGLEGKAVLTNTGRVGYLFEIMGGSRPIDIPRNLVQPL